MHLPARRQGRVRHQHSRASVPDVVDMSARLAALVLAEAAVLRAEKPELREGQAAVIALTSFDLPLADKLCQGGPKDPFYDDRRLDAFYAAVALRRYR